MPHTSFVLATHSHLLEGSVSRLLSYAQVICASLSWNAVIVRCPPSLLCCTCLLSIFLTLSFASQEWKGLEVTGTTQQCGCGARAEACPEVEDLPASSSPYLPTPGLQRGKLVPECSLGQEGTVRSGCNPRHLYSEVPLNLIGLTPM